MLTVLITTFGNDGDYPFRWDVSECLITSMYCVGRRGRGRKSEGGWKRVQEGESERKKKCCEGEGERKSEGDWKRMRERESEKYLCWREGGRGTE